MGRQRRLEYPGAFYHTMGRGNGGQSIYRGGEDMSAFLESLGETCERYGLAVHSYCLMTNHYHLLIETPNGNLGAAMHLLNSAYVRTFNRVHQQRGHLFQGRYKAILVDADAYLGWLSRYIHLNPVRAEMVAGPSGYLWSSYRAFIGKARAPSWLQTDLVLGRLGGARPAAQDAYRRFVEDAAGEEQDALISSCLGGAKVLGDEHFIENLEKLQDPERIARLRRSSPSTPAIDTVLEIVCGVFRIPLESLLQRGRRGNLARDAAIYLAGRHCGLSGRELGTRFGVGDASISMRARAFREQLTWNEALRRQVSTVEARLTLPPNDGK